MSKKIENFYNFIQNYYLLCVGFRCRQYIVKQSKMKIIFKKDIKKFMAICKIY